MLNKIQMTFTTEEWQVVLNGLALRPFNEVALIIQSMQTQYQQATSPEPESPVPQEVIS